MPSFVWNHFTKLDSTKSRCNETGCNKVISFGKGTNGLIYHLKTVHKIIDVTEASNKRKAEDSSAPQKRQCNIIDYCKKPSAEEEVARMIAESNLSFNQVAKTKFIRLSLAAKFPGRIIPQDNQGISAMMMKFYEFAESETKYQIQKMKNEGKKFSVTLDEWTSAANCRYINMNIHYTFLNNGKTSFINLGLLKIKGSCPAETMVQMVSK